MSRLFFAVRLYFVKFHSILKAKLFTMKKLSTLTLIAMACTVLYSCQKDKTIGGEANAISQETLSQISALGFSVKNVSVHEDGYLVEGDIVITKDMLRNGTDYKLLRMGNTEQYRTTNLVTGLPRNITIRVDSRLPARYVTCANAMIARYNAQNLRITMSRVTSGGNIVLTKASNGAQYLASAGFPSGGNPYTKVLINSRYLENNAWDNNSVTSILAHEVGHCIGFRHTDYYNRAISCGGAVSNEGASTVGAILIPGTPSTANPASDPSFMLACIGKNVNRPFTANDITALNYLY